MLRLSLVLLGTLALCWAWDADHEDYPPYPDSIKPCGMPPGQKEMELEWGNGMIEDDIWEEIVEGLQKKKASSIKMMRETVKGNPHQPLPNMTTPTIPPDYYFEFECPHIIMYVTSFYWAKKKRTCYVPFPVMQQAAQFVSCTRRYCCNRPSSECFLSRFLTQEVFAYCPKPAKPGRRRKSFLGHVPKRFFRWIPLTLPQCCECMTCRDMKITMLEKANNALRFTDF